MKSSLIVPVVCLIAPAAMASPTGDATRALHRYNAEEQQLAAVNGLLPAPRLLAHWKQLGAIRSQLAHVHVRALSEGQQVLLRHELSSLLGAAIDVASVKGEYADERVRTADDQRRQAMVQIARWANRHLDLSVVEVLGVRLYAKN